MKKILTQYGACALAVALMVPLAQAQTAKMPERLRTRCRSAFRQIHQPRARYGGQVRLGSLARAFAPSATCST